MPTDTWTSSQLFTANWTTAGDWSGGLPTTTSDVTIAQGGPIVTSAISIASLTFSTGGVEFESAGASSVSGSVTVSGNGILSFDKDAGTGGSSLTIGGALTLSGSFTSFDIGANTQSTGDTVTAASLSVGTGAGLGIQNETGSNETDTLDITGQAGFGTAGILTGNILIANGNGASSSVIEFGSGSITTIAANGKLTLEGPKAFIADASNLSANSALTQLATINGILDLTAISSLSLGNALTNTGSISVEDVQSVGGTSLNISGVLTNSGQITLGTSAGLSFADTITATGLTNSVGNTLGTISIGGGGGSSATLDITSQAGFGMTGVLTGTVSLSTYQSGGVYNGAAILEFSSGEITTIAANSSLSINTGNAFLADATNLSANSALTGLAANNGTVNLSNIAPLTLTGALSNTGLFNLDIATLNVSGALTNSGGHISIGATTGSGATTMAATALNNTSSGIILLSGNSNSLGQLSINGAAVNSGTVTIGTNSIIAVTGNSYTQAGGTTTINGTLTASAIDISGGTLELGSTGSLSTGVAFTGGTGTLQLDLKTNQPSSIAGATAGDTIDLRFQSFAAGDHAVWQQSGGTGALTLETSGGATLDTLTLSGQYTSANFSVATDNNNGTQIQLVNLAPPPPPPPPPAATAVMIMRNGNNGNYEIYDLGGNSIVAASAIGQVGLEWQVAGLGSFFGADTSDMLLRNSNTGQFEVYDISNNAITNAAPMGQVGLEWSVAGFGDFSSRGGETDMLMRNTNSGAFEIYDIGSNQITSAAPMGQVGFEWSVAGFGDFSTRPNETDMLMRNSNTGVFEIYDISNNQITSAAPMGQVGLEWSVVGFGDFSGNANESDMLMRNSNTGAFEIYDISNNQITSAAPMGQVGLEWQVVGFGPINGAGSSDMLMRNTNTGAFEVYDIGNNTITSAGPMGQVGLEWSVAGIAADSVVGSASANAQLAQAMASYASGSGPAGSSSLLDQASQLSTASPLAVTESVAHQM